MAAPPPASSALAHPLAVRPSQNTARWGLIVFAVVSTIGLSYTITQLSSARGGLDDRLGL